MTYSPAYQAALDRAASTMAHALCSVHGHPRHNANCQSTRTARQLAEAVGVGLWQAGGAAALRIMAEEFHYREHYTAEDDCLRRAADYAPASVSPD